MAIRKDAWSALGLVAWALTSCGAQAEPCEEPADDCGEGLVCNGAFDPPQCVEPGREDDPCRDHADCTADHACSCLWSSVDGERTCQRIPGEGEPCLEIDVPFLCLYAGCGCDWACQNGLVCNTSYEEPTCLQPAASGDPCAWSGHCQEGLVCWQDVCCRADCTGKECGDDGCGYPCGECPEGKQCKGQWKCE